MLKKKQLEKIKEEIIKEKKELEAIKEILDNKCKKIDISNVYVFKYGDFSYLVTIEKNNYPHYVIFDIFNNNKLFEFNTFEMIENKKVKIDMEITKYYNEKDRYASITPILNINKSLMKYVDKQVPEYILQQLLYKLNNIVFDNNSTKRR